MTQLQNKMSSTMATFFKQILVQWLPRGQGQQEAIVKGQFEDWHEGSVAEGP